MNQVNPSIVTRDLPELIQGTENVYASVVIISKRSRQISSKIKEELSAKLATFESSVDNLEEVFENREQIDISKHYEKMPKGTLIAVEEFLNGEIHFTLPTDEEEDSLLNL